MHTQLMKSFQMTPRSMTFTVTCILKIAIFGLFLPTGAFVFHKHTSLCPPNEILGPPNEILGHLVPSPILGLASAPIVETKFLELAMSLLDFSPRNPLVLSRFCLLARQDECREILSYRGRAQKL